MSVLEERFREWRSRGHRAFIPYLTYGYPTPEDTPRLLRGLADAGADVIELGVPFSDPLADGPTIQAATWEALQQGATVRGALDLLRELSDELPPVVLFSYLNPILRLGVEEFVEAASEAGAAGLLVTDLPAGADPGLEERLSGGGLDLIRLLAPTTDPDRIDEIAGTASGFVYYISRTGVTGAREELSGTLGPEVERLRQRTRLPVAVGFGVSTPEQAAEVAGIADGVVVGSALIDALGRSEEEFLALAGELADAVPSVREAPAG